MVIYSKDTVKEQHFIMMMLYIMSLNVFEFLKNFLKTGCPLLYLSPKQSGCCNIKIVNFPLLKYY